MNQQDPLSKDIERRMKKNYLRKLVVIVKIRKILTISFG